MSIGRKRRRCYPEYLLLKHPSSELFTRQIVVPGAHGSTEEEKESRPRSESGRSCEGQKRES